MHSVNRRSGDYVKATIIPPTHSQRPHFGLAEGLIVGFLLLCASGVVCLLLLI